MQKKLLRMFPGLLALESLKGSIFIFVCCRLELNALGGVNVLTVQTISELISTLVSLLTGCPVLPETKRAEEKPTHPSALRMVLFGSRPTFRKDRLAHAIPIPSVFTHLGDHTTQQTTDRDLKVAAGADVNTEPQRPQPGRPQHFSFLCLLSFYGPTVFVCLV